MQSLSNKVQVIVKIRVVADHPLSKMFDSSVIETCSGLAGGEHVISQPYYMLMNLSDHAMRL